MNKDEYLSKRKDILLKLKMIKVTEPPSDIPDNLTLASQEQYDREKAKIEIERFQTDLTNLKSAFTLSKWFAISIFALVFLSLLIVFGIIIWQGIVRPEIRLNDKLLMTLLSTTTVNIIGLLYLVIKYVFHHRLKV